MTDTPKPNSSLASNGKLPGRSLVAQATAVRLRELADQLTTLDDADLLEWKHLDALNEQLDSLMNSTRRAREMFGWADDLVSDGGKKTLAELVGDEQ